MKPTLLFALVIALPAPLAASSPARPGAARSDMVCRDVSPTGSRLAPHRACMTREQWAEQRRQRQADIAQGQGMLMSDCPPNTAC